MHEILWRGNCPCREILMTPWMNDLEAQIPYRSWLKAQVRDWARSLGVGRAYRAGRAAFREPMVYRELF